jgi:hypothetical protein
MTRTIIAAALAIAATSTTHAGERIPLRLGECVQTRIEQISTRLQNGEGGRPIKGSGSAVTYTNGLYGVSYEQVYGVDHSRRGDPVTVCLVSIPRGCPPGDDRGRVYSAINHRTHLTWQLPDSEHMCGGA